MGFNYNVRGKNGFGRSVSSRFGMVQGHYRVWSIPVSTTGGMQWRFHMGILGCPWNGRLACGKMWKGRCFMVRIGKPST